MKISENKSEKNLSLLFVGLVVLMMSSLNSNTFAQYPTCTSPNPCPSNASSYYTISEDKWNKSTLTYYFANGTSDITGDQEKTAFYAAFNAWAAVVPLVFQEVFSLTQADIVIRYVDLNTFKKYATESKTAVGFSPPPNMCAGNILLNDEYHHFSLDPNESNSKDLVYVAMHEIGHVLGLCHSNNSSTVMYEQFNPVRILHDYDIQGIREIYPSIKAKNNFNGGTIKAGINKAAETVDSLWSIIDASQTVNLEAVEQSNGGYNRIWNDNNYPEATVNKSKWVRNNIYGQVNRSSDRVYSFPSTTDDFNSEYVANLRVAYDLTFISGGGTIYVTGSGSHSSPYTAQVVEQNLIYAYATGYTSNYIDYTFDHWISGSQSYSNPDTATENKTYTAVYIGKPSNYGKNFTFHGYVGDPINFTWTDNPDTSVTNYQIWRRVKHNGILGDATLLATVERGVETYTDEYSFTDGYTDDMLSYDVRGHYEPDGTYSDPQWNIAYGELLAKINENSIALQTITNEIPTDYSITNYPNPFNPTTTINYQLPENGFVTIKVFDVLGKEVATLVNSNKSAGYHNVTFDASRLTSGIYIYTIQAGNYSASKKMILTK